jgi:hypothetical protein
MAGHVCLRVIRSTALTISATVDVFAVGVIILLAAIVLMPE